MCLIDADFGAELCHCRVVLVIYQCSTKVRLSAALYCSYRLVGHYSQCSSTACM